MSHNICHICGRDIVNPVDPVCACADDQKRYGELLAAALRWWKQKAPMAWPESEHHKWPDVNCKTDAESGLAIVVSNLAARR